jgi:hypothetical protein
MSLNVNIAKKSLQLLQKQDYFAVCDVRQYIIIPEGSLGKSKIV